jgi:hypothetical protein
MKIRQFSARDAAGGRRSPFRSSFSDRAYAGFSLMGFWQANKASVLLVAAILAVIVVLVLWIARRRRQETFPELQPDVPDRTADMGMTQIEPQPEPVEKAPATASSGIYGKIEVVVGSQQISSYLVTDNSLTIGRDPAQSVVIIPEPIVSKLHCQIFSRAGKVFIRDLNSTNGLYLNEEKINERELQDKDVVFLGKKGTVKIIYSL